MDYEREKGRIKGHTTTRNKSIDFAKKMVPLLVSARLELPNYGGDGPSMRAIADWLNKNGHFSRRNRKWSSQTISRLLDVHLLGMAEIEKEYEIAANMRSYILKNPSYPMRKERLAELAEMDAKRVQSVVEMRKLAAALKGQPYIERPMPPPPTLSNESQSNIKKEVPKREDEEQLSLFPDMP